MQVATQGIQDERHFEQNNGTQKGIPIRSRPQYGNEDAQIPLTAETLLEIARVLRADCAVSLDSQADARAVGKVDWT